MDITKYRFPVVRKIGKAADLSEAAIAGDGLEDWPSAKAGRVATATEMPLISGENL
jgi:hypothetical protein